MRREAARLGAVESRVAQRFARVAVCSEADAARWPNEAERVWVVPNGTSDLLFERAPIPRIPGRLVFVGTLGYRPNEDALLFFVSQILPRLIEREPGVTLAIVGRKPPASISRLHDGSRVFVHSDVADVAPYVQEAAVSIVPLRVGGGTRLKILESLALRTPVVSTTIGAEGLEFQSGEHLLLADTAEDFAEAVLCLIQNAQTRERLSAQGAARTSELYRWSSIRDRFAARLRDWAAEMREAIPSNAD
jgi:glycosyltransferase involved in cell wall biosynthesis